MAFSKITTLATTTIKAGFTAFNSLIDDILSTASGKGASQVGIEDSAANLAAANVEDALAEIYTDISSAQTMADILDENSATTTGLTWGFKAGLIRTDNTVTSVSAGTVVLTDDDVNYVEVRKNGAVVANVTGFTVGRIPIRQVTCASGAQTVSTDKRAWFHTLSDNVVIGTTITIPNAGLHILDSNATHDLIIKPGANLSADRTLTVTTSDADRTVTLHEDFTIADGYAVTITAEDAAGAIVLDNCGLEIEDATNAGNKIKIINATSDDDKVLTVHENFTLGNGHPGTLTYSAASKILTVEDTSVVNQDLSSDASPTFAGVTLGNEGLHLLDTGGDHDLIIKPGSDLAADRILTLTTGDAARTVTLSGNLTISDTVTLKAADIFPAATVMLFGQNAAPTGWTRKTNWQDTSMICYAATGDCGSGGSVNPQSTHTHTGPDHNHQWHNYIAADTLPQSYTSAGVADNLTFTAVTQDHIGAHTGGTDGLTEDCYTTKNGTGATGASTGVYYQEVIAATKD